MRVGGTGVRSICFREVEIRQSYRNETTLAITHLGQLVGKGHKHILGHLNSETLQSSDLEVVVWSGDRTSLRDRSQISRLRSVGVVTWTHWSRKNRKVPIQWICGMRVIVNKMVIYPSIFSLLIAYHGDTYQDINSA